MWLVDAWRASSGSNSAMSGDRKRTKRPTRWTVLRCSPALLVRRSGGGRRSGRGNRHGGAAGIAVHLPVLRRHGLELRSCLQVRLGRVEDQTNVALVCILRLYRDLVHLDRHVLLTEAEEAADADHH